MKDEPILRVENVHKRYGNREILKGVSLSIRKGELKVLIGPSGGGKSTLLQCINFLVTPEVGEVWLEGRRIDHTHKKELYRYRQQVGMIFQDFNLFDHLSAVQNIEVSLIHVKGMGRKQARERAMAELERVGLMDHANHFPAHLSGGQKQRVSIARALAMDPKVMLLDEPTSALDPELIGEVLSVIRDLVANGMTMFMATHQIGFSRAFADEIIFMEEGRILETGPPAKILSEAQCERTREFCSKISELYGEAG
ncbi:MAG: amino acid ABC transporter ATP-binding protein [Deltaproteobacteria bacterium]|nr:amino acid ABC transporter ATP-binding protein [Deltaproteobacteria bacterium]